jgi:hypothetical protein
VFDGKTHCGLSYVLSFSSENRGHTGENAYHASAAPTAAIANLGGSRRQKGHSIFSLTADSFPRLLSISYSTVSPALSVAQASLRRSKCGLNDCGLARPSFYVLIEAAGTPDHDYPNREQGADCEDYFHRIAPVMADSTLA